jgi:hypothetical protein
MGHKEGEQLDLRNKTSTEGDHNEEPQGEVATPQIHINTPNRNRYNIKEHNLE